MYHFLIPTSDQHYLALHQITAYNFNCVLGIPYALHEAGFGFGLLLLIFIAYVTDYSLILMVKSGHLSGKFSYQGIMEAAFGRPGYILLGLLQCIYPLIGT